MPPDALAIWETSAQIMEPKTYEKKEKVNDLFQICVYEDEYPDTLRWAEQVRQSGGIATPLDLAEEERAQAFVDEQLGGKMGVSGNEYLLSGMERQHCLAQLAVTLLDNGARGVLISRERSIDSDLSPEQGRGEAKWDNFDAGNYFRSGKLRIVTDPTNDR